MPSLRRSSHFPSVFTLIFPSPMLTLPLLLAHFKLSHVGGCQTGAPQCGVSLIRADRHQRERAACVCGLRSRRLIFIFIFPPPEFFLFFPETSRRNPPLLSVCDASPASPVHRLISLPPSLVPRSLGWAARATPWPFSPYGTCGGTASAWTAMRPVCVLPP